MIPENENQNINENENENENENIESIEDSDEEHGFDNLDDAVDSLDDDDENSESDEINDEENSEGKEDSEIVTLEDGEEIELKDLKKGYEQNKDYEQRVEKLEVERREIESLRDSYGEKVDRIKETYDNLTRLLEGVAFAEPDPQLARSDPASYQYQTALRNNALAQLQNVYAGRERTESMFNAEMQKEMDRFKSSENEKLLEMNPKLKDKKQKEKFDENNRRTALEFGFQEEEINQTADHRILQLVHYARLGKIAERNRQNAARRIAETPRKGAKAKSISVKMPRNKKAMQKLDKTGSIQSAMAVEFE